MPTLPDAVVQGFERLSEETSRALAQQIQIAPVTTDLQAEPIATAYVQAGPVSDRPPLLLIPGFDSSLLEYRRLLPRLAQEQETWTIDLLGFGFTDRPPTLRYNPANLQTHLYATWQQLIQRPVILVGASMGGAATIEFALAYPEAVAGLVLLDSAGVKNGPTIGKFLFPPLDRWAVEFLRRPDVRHNISRSAYHTPDTYATPDADTCMMLHLLMPHWDTALKSFTKSGGYPSVKQQLKNLKAPTLVVWGKQDKILGTQDATVMAQEIPTADLVWIDSSGHVPHLEQSEAVAQAILHFVQGIVSAPAQ